MMMGPSFKPQTSSFREASNSNVPALGLGAWSLRFLWKLDVGI
jgi:hypothetical protein